MFKIILLLSFFIPGTRNDGDSTYNVDKNKILTLVNDIRKKGCDCGGTYMRPVQPVAWNDQLAKVAYQHSKYMDGSKMLSHLSPGGANAGKRIKESGYNWKAYGENIAYNYPDEEAVVQGWLKSVNHCKTLMGSYFTEMGVGRSGAYWTQDFGMK